MAPKKSKKTGLMERPVGKRGKKTSELDYDYDPLAKDEAAPTKSEPTVENREQNPPVDEDMDPAVGIAGYVLNQIEKNINVRHVFQVFILLFLANLLYLWFKQKSDDWVETGTVGNDPMDKMILASCVFMIAVLEFFAIANSRFKTWKKKVSTLSDSKEDPKVIEEKRLKLAADKPELPDFNYIYSIFLPLALVLLLAPQYVIFVAICVVQIGEMHMAVRALISYVIVFQFSGMAGDAGLGAVTASVTNSIPTSAYLKVPLICTLQHEAFNKFLGSSMPTYERALLVTASTYLITVPNIYIADLTIVVMKNLFTSLLVAIYFSFGIYWLYRRQVESSLKYLLNLALYIVFIGTFTVVSDKLLFPIIGKLHVNWIKDFINENAYRLMVFKYWSFLALLVIPLIFTVFIKVAPWAPIDFKRKIWHFVLFFMVLVPMVHDPQLVSVALFGVAGILIVTELIRSADIPPFGQKINAVFETFLDSKDEEGDCVTSYIYLVLGVGTPLWFSNLDITRETSYLGLVTLGFGDSFASIIGRKFGQNKWPNSKKSIEGTVAFALGSILAFLIVDYFVSQAGITLVGCNWTNRMVLIILISCFEAFIDVNDNLLVPVFATVAEEVLILFS